MKIEKGQPGYILARRKRLLLLTVLEFSVVAALLSIGIIQTGTRLNLLTVAAVLACLPACKMLVGLLTILPYKTTDPEVVEEIESKASLLTTAYDMVITSRERIMPVTAVVIAGNTVFGYAPDRKTDPKEAGSHIKTILEQNQISKATVKIFSDYTPFLARVEGLNNIAEVEKMDRKRQEEKICRLILNISM